MTTHKDTGILLVNLGTPRSPAPLDVFHYLNEFLTDGRVIDVPWLWRQLLVRGFIVPARFRNSARTYREVWTDRGSPLLLHGLAVRDRLQERLGDDFVVSLAMRYKEPSIPAALEQLERHRLRQLIILPLFPQYASATTGSVHQKVMESIKGWEVIPSLSFVNEYATHPAFIDAWAAIGAQHDPLQYDHILFSFHGLPEKHLTKADRNGCCLRTPNCCEPLTRRNRDCYRAQCYATARAIAARLQLPPERYSIAFQSRLGKEPWTQPYTVEQLAELPKRGIKSLLVFAPAFTADCLETTYEIGEEYALLFKEHGGEKLQLVESLNDHPLWIEALQAIAMAHVPLVNTTP